MGLIYRNGRPYLYRSIRRGGRVTSEYVGAGATAETIALLEAVEREERDQEREDFRAEARASESVEDPLDDYCAQVEKLASAALFAAGYHRPKRQWRKRRDRIKG